MDKINPMTDPDPMPLNREVRRVPRDFDWPLGKPWEGYEVPDRLLGAPCPAGDDCVNGTTWAWAWAYKVLYLLPMLADDLRDQARGRPMHPYFSGIQQPSIIRSREYYDRTGRYAYTGRPSADIEELITALNGRDTGPLGFGGATAGHIMATLVEAAGLPSSWGLCPGCDGAGSVEAYPGQRAALAAWKRTDPPTGDGWQLWETVSGGSPVSPVFVGQKALATWLIINQEKGLLEPGIRLFTIQDALNYLGMRKA